MPAPPAPQRRPGRPTAEQAAEIDALVLRGARALFLEQGPGASMDDIATAVGVSKLTIYRRFAGKEDLLLAVIDRDLDRLADRIDSAIDPDDAPLARLETMARAIFDFIVEPENVRMSRLFVRDLYDAPRLRERVARWRGIILDRLLPAITRAQRAGTLVSCDPQLLSDILVELLQAQGERLRYADQRPDDAELARFFAARWRFFLRGAADSER